MKKVLIFKEGDVYQLAAWDHFRILVTDTEVLYQKSRNGGWSTKRAAPREPGEADYTGVFKMLSRMKIVPPYIIVE